MRLFGILLVLAGTAIAAPAQTNVPGNVRQLSLQDCIQMTLQHNLDLQIDRYDPQVALFSLQANYGGYDPTFSISGQHDHSESGPQLLGGLNVPGSTSDDNSFSSSINGLLPWGTTYNLGTGSAIRDTYGDRPTTVDDLAKPPIFTTNSFVNLNNGDLITYRNTNFVQKPSRQSFESSGGSVALSVTQPLLKNFLIDPTRLTIRVAKNRLKYTELNLKLQIMQTVTRLEQAYYDLIYDRENVAVQEKALEAANRLAVENKRKVEVGSLAPLDLESAESQAASSEADLIAARSGLANQEHIIKQFITSQYSGWADVSVVPAGSLTAPRPFLNRQDSWSKGLSQRPELLQAKLDTERQGIQLKYDKNQLLPELDVFGTYGFSGSGREFSDALYDIQQTDRPFYTFGAQLSVPLTRTAARNNYRASKSVMEQTVLRVKKLERDIMVAIDNDIRTAQSSFEQVAARRKAREFAEADLGAEQKKLESGKSTTYTVLQKQRDLTTARGNEIQALATYNKSLSQLSLDEGSTFDRLNINLQVK